MFIYNKILDSILNKVSHRFFNIYRFAKYEIAK
jgi:hypothetical protein